MTVDVALPPTPPLNPNELNGFDKLVDEIKKILGPSSGINSDDVDVEHLMETMRRYDSSREIEWSQYALADPSRAYTRNGVDDINHKANLLILVWNPGRGSMIHDHADAHCIVKVLKGRLVETLYDWPQDHQDQDDMHVKRVSEYTTGQVSYMSDQIGLHKMSNPDPNEPAVSLHLYTPPYAAKFGCHIFDERTGKSHKVDLSTLYSDKGVVLHRKYQTA
ncbi:hypothetical protein TRICI_004438 [Trichomonascus ciferrii]|uniref:Cysteine dioxygenase n=1 Tax=Trichomonascus ciferrii TaxID=44093 RepID=A0A642V2C2_9ASCO|nr:hypothetical protein TRICI_004438 [Trichomonascus ciferrii]